MAGVAAPPTYLDGSDYALVVGINDYPWYSPLKGPVNDAKAFVRWLRDPQGGAIPLGSGPLGLDRVVEFYSDAAQPGEPERDEVFARCADLVEAAQAAVPEGGRLARRITLFFAGHGISSDDLNEGCLLMANVRKSLLGYNVPGNALAQYFVKTGLFSEVVLFMDCCRTRKLTAQTGTLPMNLLGSAPADVTEFSAFAAPWGDVAREQPFPPDPPTVHGVFTKAVLAGLDGHAAEGGRVTGASLAKYINTTVAGYLGEDYQKPRIVADPNREIVFGTQARGTQVTVAFAPGATGEVELQDGRFAKIGAHRREDGPWSFELSMGLYRLVDRATGAKRTLEPEGETMAVTFP